MSVRFHSAKRRVASIVAAAALVSLGAGAVSAAPSTDWVQLPRYKTPALLSSALVGRLAPSQKVSVSFVLPLQNTDELKTLLHGLYSRQSSTYGHYLSPSEFAGEFSPSQADYDAVADFARSQGLTVTATHPNRIVLTVSGPSSAVESAFHVQMNSYKGADGASFVAADRAASLPADIAARVVGVSGLDNSAQVKPNIIVKQSSQLAAVAAEGKTKSSGIGTGHNGGLAPSDILTAYTQDGYGIAQNGSGQTIGLMELDGYTPSDITTYEDYYYSGKTLPAITNELVDGATGTTSGGIGEAEVDLDIDMALAIAPQAHIYVYEAPNSTTGILDDYTQIATDDIAKSVSTSWGLWEDQYSDATFQDAEAEIFQEFAAQGQSFFAATGDYGAWDPDTGNISIQDPASQPYATAVGGTTLSVNSDETYSSETTWFDGTFNDFTDALGGGGGYSNVWSIPDYQAPSLPVLNLGSLYARNTPDISMDADPNTGYDIYTSYDKDGWVNSGGTSAGAPISAAFIADVNQSRKAINEAVLGYANPALYDIERSSFISDFHDIADGSNNGEYYADDGYDDATGIGSLDFWNLMFELTWGAPSRAVPLPPADVVATPGDTYVVLSFNPSLGATDYIVYVTPFDAPGNIGIITTSVHDKITIHNVPNGVTYSYYLVATNSAGGSGYSQETAGVMPNPVQFIAAPSVYANNGLAVITWNTNVISDAKIYYSTDPTLHSGVQIADVTHFSLAHKISITGLTHGATYYYKAQSYDSTVTAIAPIGSFTP